MKRLAFWLFGIVALGHGLSADAATTLVMDKKFEGEVATTSRYVGNIDDFRNSIPGYTMELSLQLKAGQEVTIEGGVIGKGRKIAFLLEDPVGARVEFVSYKELRSEFTVESVSATGKYKLTVLSDRIGPFTVLATEPTNEKDSKASIEMLEADVKRLRMELEEAESKLKAAKTRK